MVRCVRLVLVATLVALLGTTPVLARPLAVTNIDTTACGSTVTTNSDANAFGQVVTVPAVDTILTSFTLDIRLGRAAKNVNVFVYAWDGATSKVVGAPLYSTAAAVGAGSTATPNLVVFNLPAPGLTLTAGQTILLAVTSTDAFPIGVCTLDVYPGGALFAQAPVNVANPWDPQTPNGEPDASFQAAFVAPPTPTATATSTATATPTVTSTATSTATATTTATPTSTLSPTATSTGTVTPQATATATATTIPQTVVSANPDAYTTPFNATLNVPAPGVLTNDTPPGAVVVVPPPVSSPSHGSLTLNADGSFNYTPVAGFSGVDTFQYRISSSAATDARGIFSSVGTVTITVGAAPSPTPVVPELPPLWLFGSGLLALAWLHRRGARR